MSNNELPSGVTGIDLAGKTVILRKNWFNKDLQDRNEEFPFHCRSGNGCDPGKLGTGIFGEFDDEPGNMIKIQRGDVLRVVGWKPYSA